MERASSHTVIVKEEEGNAMSHTKGGVLRRNLGHLGSGVTVFEFKALPVLV
jgi:hypothetical protein